MAHRGRRLLRVGLWFYSSLHRVSVMLGRSPPRLSELISWTRREAVVFVSIDCTVLWAGHCLHTPPALAAAYTRGGEWADFHHDWQDAMMHTRNKSTGAPLRSTELVLRPVHESIRRPPLVALGGTLQLRKADWLQVRGFWWRLWMCRDETVHQWLSRGDEVLPNLAPPLPAPGGDRLVIIYSWLPPEATTTPARRRHRRRHLVYDILAFPPRHPAEEAELCTEYSRSKMIDFWGWGRAVAWQIRRSYSTLHLYGVESICGSSSNRSTLSPPLLGPSFRRMMWW